jgi:hypothetical protein
MRGSVSLFLLGLMLPAPAALYAQAQGEFGVKGGVSFGNISNKGVLPGNLKTRTGFAGGLYAGARFTAVGIGIEGLYAQRGVKSDQAIATSNTKLDYIDVPAYVKVTIPTPGVAPFIYAGPQVSFEVRCHTANDAPCGASPTRRKTDYAGIIGAGVHLGSPGKIGLGIEGRFVYGLRNLELSTVTSSTSFKNRSFMILGSIGS